MEFYSSVQKTDRVEMSVTFVMVVCFSVKKFL